MPLWRHSECSHKFISLARRVQLSLTLSLGRIDITIEGDFLSFNLLSRNLYFNRISANFEFSISLVPTETTVACLEDSAGGSDLATSSIPAPGMHFTKALFLLLWRKISP